MGPRVMVAFVAGALLLCAAPLALAQTGGGLEASASASGAASRMVGADPYDMGANESAEGRIDVRVTEKGDRWSQLQQVDTVDVRAEFSSGGRSYSVVIDKAMPRHPMGAYTTWFGVALEKEMHGDTGIGTNAVPTVKPAIALWGYATVVRGGETLATMAPAHVMVMPDGPMRGITLEVATEDHSLLQEPAGYVHAAWPAVDSLSMPTDQRSFREALGWGALVGVTILFGGLALVEGRRARWRD